MSEVMRTIWLSEDGLVEGSPLTYPRHLAEPGTDIKLSCRAYVSSRTATYRQRCERFDEVIDDLQRFGCWGGDSVCDVGAGQGQFERRLSERGFMGRYRAVDGCIDGTNLEEWEPEQTFDWFVAMEVLEHLIDWNHLLVVLFSHAAKGVVITTPNPAVVDVLACDPTHVSVITEIDLISYGFEVRRASCFGKPADTLVGVWMR